MRHPGVLLTRIHTERDRTVDAEGRILADEVIAGRVPHFDRVVLDRVEDLKRRDDLAAGKGADLELVVGHLGDPLGEVFGAAVDRVEAFRPARRHAPFDLGLGLRDRRCRQGRPDQPDTPACKQAPPPHRDPPSVSGQRRRLPNL